MLTNIATSLSVEVCQPAG